MSVNGLACECVGKKSGGVDHQLQVWVLGDGQPVQSYRYELRQVYTPGGKVTRQSVLSSGVFKPTRQEAVDEGLAELKKA